MTAIYIIGALFVVVFAAILVVWANHRACRSEGEQSDDEQRPKKVLPPGCCGQHEVCERAALLEAMQERVEYYDDEELDRFQGREAAAYSDDEIEEFREVLYTMRDDEVSGWLRSLQMRGVVLPDAVKDEAFLMINDSRGGQV